MTEPALAADRPVRRLLYLAPGALSIGVACSLVLLGLSFAAEGLQAVLWEQIPDALGADGDRRAGGSTLPVKVLPSLALAATLMLAGGVSLGPENPITAINVGLAYAAGHWLGKRAAPPVWAGIAVAGTVGALFGTPVAAALLLSESQSGDPAIPLWNRLFAPLLAAGAGSLTSTALADIDMSVPRSSSR